MLPALVTAELQEMVASAGVNGLTGKRDERCTGGGPAAGQEQARCEDKLLVDIADLLRRRTCKSFAAGTIMSPNVCCHAPRRAASHPMCGLHVLQALLFGMIHTRTPDCAHEPPETAFRLLGHGTGHKLHDYWTGSKRCRGTFCASVADTQCNSTLRIGGNGECALARPVHDLLAATLSYARAAVPCLAEG